MNSLKTTLLFCLFLIIFSCNDKEKEDLNEEEKILYDSLKKIAFNDIRLRTDSICNLTKDQLFQTYVDSLMALRRNEIDALFNEE